MYFIAYELTGSAFIIILLSIFIILDSYSALFIYKLENIKKDKITTLRSVFDTLFVFVFIVYYSKNFIL